MVTRRKVFSHWRTKRELNPWLTEQPRRIPYLASLQVMIDSHALLLVGSDEPHYTPSKVFPYVLAERPLLAVFHEDSSVVRILGETAQSE